MNLRRVQELNRIVKESYDLTANHFNATRSKMATTDFLWAAERISSNDKVLDAACGNGRLLDYVNLTTNKYLGIDSNEKLIKIAKGNYSDYNFECLNLQNITTLKEQDFSRIFCSATIIHIPGEKERIRLLKDFYQLSTDDAKLIISAWKMTGKHYWKLKLESILKNLFKLKLNCWRELVFSWRDQDGIKVGLRYYHLFSRRGLKKELIAAGWRVQESLNDRHNFWYIAVK